MTEGDVGDLNLLEWSHELDRALLNHAFRPLRSSMDDKDACFLYKLAYSSSRKEVGLLLLDCDACNAFYEGLSLRTLDRRTKMDSKNSISSYSADAGPLVKIVDAIHHALDPCTALDQGFKTTVGLETTRFSSSLSISVKSKDDSSRDFKTSFDLDPLDHTSASNMISSHFVRPLLSLVAVLSRSASQQQLDSIQQQQDVQGSDAVSADSLELLRRSALTNARLPIRTFHPLSASQSASEPRTSTVGTAQNDDDTLPPAAGLHDFDYPTDADMIFFGPTGLKPPTRKGKTQPTTTKPPLSVLDSPDPDSDIDVEDGDRTLTAPLAVPPDLASSPTFAREKRVRGLPAEDDSDSTSEEESLPVAGTDHSSQPPSIPSSPAKQRNTTALSITRTTPASAGDAPESSPPPPSSAVSSSSRLSVRDEQQRRREEIARIKRRGKEQADSTNVSGAGSRSTATSRKRARF